jgi:hypothetical protein
MATNTPTLFFRGAATTTTTTVLYTVPASTVSVVTNIAVVNTAATSATFTMGMGTAGANTSLHTTTTIAANSTIYIDLKQALNATNTITGGASATTVSFHISGIQQA